MLTTTCSAMSTRTARNGKLRHHTTITTGRMQQSQAYGQRATVFRRASTATRGEIEGLAHTTHSHIHTYTPNCTFPHIKTRYGAAFFWEYRLASASVSEQWMKDTTEVVQTLFTGKNNSIHYHRPAQQQSSRRSPFFLAGTENVLCFITLSLLSFFVIYR